MDTILVRRVDNIPQIIENSDIFIHRKTPAFVDLTVATQAGDALVSLGQPVELVGPTSAFHGETVEYTIQNYQTGRLYSATAIGAAVCTVEEDTITLRVDNTSLTAIELIVEERTFPIEIKAIHPVAPTIIEPYQGQTRISLEEFDLQLSAFAMNKPDDPATEASVIWEISNQSDFSVILDSGIEEPGNIFTLEPNHGS